MKTVFSKIILMGIFVLNSSLSLANSEKTKIKNTVKCMSSYSDYIQSPDDLRASFGEEEGDEIYEAQADFAKNDFIKCVRKNNSKCAVKSLDELIKSKKSRTSTVDILEAVQSCI